MSRYNPNIERPPSSLDYEAMLFEQREEWLEGIKHGQTHREHQAFANIDFLLDCYVDFVEYVESEEVIA